MKKCKFLVLIALGVGSHSLAWAQVKPYLELESTKLCHKVQTIYSKCETQIKFDSSNTFEFTYKNGREFIPCDDGQDLTFYQRLKMMDVVSLFMYPYITGQTLLPETRKDWDPGRLRVEGLFKQTFGATEGEIRSQLVPVTFLGQTIRFQKRLGAANALRKVDRDLNTEMQKDPSLKKFLQPFTSKKVDLRMYGFAYRYVSGTTRLSSHSFGTAIDLLLDTPAQYWLWDEKIKNPQMVAQGEQAYEHYHYIPDKTPHFHPKAVEIFERHGFIWGGKWNHYDTMHFEYRPEFYYADIVDCER